MSTPRSRIHLILPELTDAQACALLDVCGDLIDALWNTHGDVLIEFCTRRAEHEDLERCDDDLFASTEDHEDEIDEDDEDEIDF